MTPLNIAGLAVIFLFVLWIIGERWNSFAEAARLLSMLALWIVLGGSLITSCATSEWYKKQEQEKAQKRHEQAVRERTPRLVSEAADGCKVFTFKTDRWYYYTRCPNSVTTTNTTYTTSCGKNCRKEHVNSITTEDK